MQKQGKAKVNNQKLKHKQMYIRGDIHLQLKRYCCDHSTTIVDAATLAVTQFLKDKNYLTQQGANKNA